jgi:hypothetical protein
MATEHFKWQMMNKARHGEARRDAAIAMTTGLPLS